MRPDLQSSPTPRKIGLFGGTFDPVHVGHLHLAELAKNALGLDEVRFLPCQISPHKPGTLPASAEDRLAMLRLAADGLAWATVDDFELAREGPSFSYQTAEAMAARFPAARLFWIMGGDQWEALPRWKNPDRLAGLVEFAVLARGKTPQERGGYRLHVVAGTHPSSATEIRGSHREGNHEWLPPGVSRYIREHDLYHA